MKMEVFILFCLFALGFLLMWICRILRKESMPSEMQIFLCTVLCYCLVGIAALSYIEFPGKVH